MMKSTIFIYFILCAFSTSAQVEKDSVWTEQVGGKFFQVRYVELENGASTTTKTLLGSGSSQDAYEVSYSSFRERVRGMALIARTASLFSMQLTDIIRENQQQKTLFSKSPIDTLQAQNISAFLLPGWTLKQGATVSDVTFTVTAGGQMRSNLGVAPRNVTNFGEALRLHNFPASGQSVDLFMLQNGNFVSLDRSYILRRPGSGQQAAKKKKN